MQTRSASRSGLDAESSSTIADMSTLSEPRISLENVDDQYLEGTLYIGAPNSQPVRLVFDTGSELLAVTSILCDDSKMGPAKLKVIDPTTGNPKDTGFQSGRRCSSTAYNFRESTTSDMING